MTKEITVNWLVLFKPEGAGRAAEVDKLKVIDAFSCNDSSYVRVENSMLTPEKRDAYLKEHGEGAIMLVKQTKYWWL